MRALGTLTLLLALAMGIIVTSGCKPRERSFLLYAAIDNSESVTDTEREAQTMDFEEMIEQQGGRAHVLLYLFAQSEKRIYQGDPWDWLDMKDVDNKLVIQGGQAQGKGTNWTPVLNKMIKEAKKSPNKPLIVAMLTDGGCNDPQETKKTAKALSELPNFRCMFVGPLKSQIDRDYLSDKILGPINSADKLIICNEYDKTQAMDRLASVMKEVQ